MTGSKKDWSLTLFGFTMHFPVPLSDECATCHRFSQQLLKLQLIFPENFKRLLQFDSNLLYHIFWYVFLIFNNVLWHLETFFSTGNSSVARASVTFFFLLRALIFVLAGFFFQTHRSKLKNFQTHKWDHTNKLLFGNSHFLQFLQYFHWVM